MNPNEIRKEVAQVLDRLPRQFRKHLSNLEIVVEGRPGKELLLAEGLDPRRDTLYGLYQGVPLPDRSAFYPPILPDKITIFSEPLLRDFTAADDRTAPPVMIVNQTFARRFFQESSPLGRKVRVSGNRVFTVVGLVKDIKYRNLSEGGQPYFYMPFEQRYQQGRNIFLYLRGDGDPDGLRATLRTAASRISGSASSRRVRVSRSRFSRFSSSWWMRALSFW